MKKRSLSDYASISLKGMAMGAVEFLPGISGGTIAFVTGVYEELLETIKGAFPSFKQFLGQKTLAQRFTDFWKALNGNFIVALMLGIVVAAVATVKVVKHTMTAYPIVFYAFIFGLIVASVVLVYKKVSKWTLKCYLLGLVGVGLAMLLPIQPHSTTAIVPLWYLFIGACLASCAYILPGTSGTFVLLLMGAYNTLIYAVDSFAVPYLAVFILGCLTGLVSFSNVLSWLLKKYHDWTVALLTGFIVGSLKIIWPWKASTLFRLSAEGIPYPAAPQNVWPATYELHTALPAMTQQAIIACVVGVVIVLGIEFVAKLLPKKQS